MSRADMLALAGRVERGDGTDRELEAQIGRYAPRLVAFLGAVANEPTYGCARYLSSLDAAMTLVPDGCNPVTILLDAIDANRSDNWLHVLPRYVAAAALRALAERMTDD